MQNTHLNNMKIKKFQFGGPGGFTANRKEIERRNKAFGAVRKKTAQTGLTALGWLGNAFNTVLTSGASSDFGQTSPFVNMDRHAVAKARENTRLKAKQTVEKATPYISPANHITAWTQGSFNPIIGAQKLEQLGPEAQLAGAIFDIATLSKGKPTIRGTARAVDKGLAKAGSTSAKGRVVAREINKGVDKGIQGQQQVFPGLVGWGQKQTFKGYHASNESTFQPNFFFNGWAQHQVEVDLDRPMVQIGEVKGTSKNSMRNQIEKDSQQQGADGIIFQDIADNQMQHQTVLKTLNPDVPIRLNRADDVAEAYSKDRGIVANPMYSNGQQRFIWRKNRWSKEGSGLIEAKFRPDEYTDNHHITINPTEEAEIPNKTYFMGINRLPFNGKSGTGLGDNISTVFTPNLQYNAWRQLHWMEPKVQELGQQYLSTGNLRPILDYYRNATPLEKQQLSSIARQPMFLNSDIPYRFYNDNNVVMKENPMIQKEVNEMSPHERNMFNNSLGWATSNDKGMPVIFNKQSGFAGDRTVGHEGNHAYQQRFPQPQNMQEVLERALPAEQTKLVKGKEQRLSGNDKRGIGSAHLNMERGATVQDARALIIREYYRQHGRIPSLTELNTIIDNMAEADLTKTVRSTSAYGREYAPLINDFGALREVLKFGYKKGGKI